MTGYIRKIFITIVCIAGWPVFGYSQINEEFRAESITSEYVRIGQGLSQNTVNTVLQDSRGYIWAGTWSGLNRFDGYEVKKINKDYHNPEKGLTNPTINGIVEDSLGNIWVATVKGLNKINPRSFEIEQYTTESHGQKGLVNDTILSIYIDRFNILWLGTCQGAFALDPQTQEFTHYIHNPRDSRTLSNRFVTCFEEDSSNLWIGTRNGLNLLIRKSGNLSSFYHQEEVGQLSSSWINSLEYSDGGEQGYIWVGTDFGLNRLDIQKNWFEPYFLVTETRNPEIISQNYINCLFNDPKDELWVGSENLGLFFFDKNLKRFESINRFIPDGNQIRTNSILDVIKDQNGLYWVGTSHRGVLKLIPEPHAFKSYLRGEATYGITELEDGILYFGTQNGVNKFDLSLNRTVEIINYDPTDSNSLSSNLITTFFKDQDYLWIGTRNGLNKYHLKSKENTRYFPGGNSETSIAGREVWNMTRAHDERIWISTNNGLTIFDPVSGKMNHFFHDPANPNSLSSNDCRQVFELEPGIFLISTDYGLNKFNQKSNSWEVFLPVPGDLLSISSESIFGVFRDSHDEIWIYTNGGGINRFDPATNTFEHFSELDGLSDNIVYAITEDEFGYFWLTTNNGLNRFDPAEERFIQFDVQDGLLSNEFNLNGLYTRDNGEIFVGSVNGISSFFPLEQTKPDKDPSLQFTNFTIHDERNGSEIPITNQIKLDYDQNSFTVSFAIMDFTNPYKNRFEYMLENFDESFSALGEGNHQVEYRKISPGNYNLIVNGYNSYGVSTKQSLGITIVPAWFQTMFFKIFSGSFIIILISFIIYVRYTGINHRHRMEKKLLTTQNELIQSQKFALRSQMNPHFIFNSLNSIQNFVLKNEVDSANYYLSNFSILMRRVLEYSQFNLITLDEEIQLIELYIKMEKLRFSNKFDVIIDVDPKIDVHQVKIPPMFLQPYLENAILHGLQLIKRRGLLHVNFRDRKNHMAIEIRDNGIGRARANEIRAKQVHKSKGLKNIEKRIQLYNSINSIPIQVAITDLFEDEKPSGTLVQLTIPYELDEPES